MHSSSRSKNYELDGSDQGLPPDTDEKSGTLAWLDPDWSIVRWIKNWMNSDNNRSE